MTLADLVIAIKRQGRFGDIANTSDQSTLDVLTSVNARRSRFWRKYNWDWSLQPISLSYVRDTTEYTIIPASAIGDVLLLAISGKGPLTRITPKRYYQWKLSDTVVYSTPKEYFHRGLDSNGRFQITLWPTPDAAGTIVGFGKKKITDYVVGDIATNTGLEYFPDYTHEILIQGGLSDIAKIQGDMAASGAFNAEFERQMQQLVPEVTSQGDQELSSPPPDRYVFAKRARSGTNTA